MWHKVMIFSWKINGMQVGLLDDGKQDYQSCSICSVTININECRVFKLVEIHVQRNLLLTAKGFFFPVDPLFLFWIFYQNKPMNNEKVICFIEWIHINWIYLIFLKINSWNVSFNILLNYIATLQIPNQETKGNPL